MIKDSVTEFIHKYDEAKSDDERIGLLAEERDRLQFTPLPRGKIIENNYRLRIALDIANAAHRHELRNFSGLPYMSHIYDIMKLAHQIGIPITDEAVYCSIVLHDAVESGYRLEVIGLGLPEIAPIVEELTFVGEFESKPEYMASFADKSITSLLVKTLDRICNVRDFLDGNDSYARRYFDKAYLLFRAMSDRQDEIKSLWGEQTWVGLHSAYLRLKTNLDA